MHEIAIRTNLAPTLAKLILYYIEEEYIAIHQPNLYF